MPEPRAPLSTMEESLRAFRPLSCEGQNLVSPQPYYVSQEDIIKGRPFYLGTMPPGVSNLKQSRLLYLTEGHSYIRHHIL